MFSQHEHLHQAFQINEDLTLLKMYSPTNNKLEVPGQWIG